MECGNCCSSFLIVQVACDLYLPTVTANIIDNGVAKNNIGYIWSEGFKMLFVAMIGVLAAAGNIYFAATQSQKKWVKRFVVLCIARLCIYRIKI